MKHRNKKHEMRPSLSLSFKEAEKKFIKKNSNQLFGGFENFETFLEKIKKPEKILNFSVLSM